MRSLIAIALSLASVSAMAADLSSVGTTGVEAVASYDYSRSQDTSYWSSQHDGAVGLQLNLGKLGSVAGEAGDHQVVGNYRNNFTSFSATYANGFHVGSVGVVGAVNYAVNTGDVWFPLAAGKNHDANIQTYTGTVELTQALSKHVKLFGDYSYENVSADHQVDANVQTAAGGLYVTAGKVVLKAGYTRSFTTPSQYQGLVTSIAYKF